MKHILHFCCGILLCSLAQAQEGSYSLKYGGYWDFDHSGYNLVVDPQTGNLLVGNKPQSSATKGTLFEFDKDSVVLQNTYFEGNQGDSAFSVNNFTIDREGNIYSVNNSLVRKFNKDKKYKGIFLSLEAENENNNYTDNLDLGSDGNLYYNTFVDIYSRNPETGLQTAKLGVGFGNGDDQFYTLEDMYFDKALPYFYTVDGLKNRVCKHDMQGHFLKCAGKSGGGAGNFSDFPRQVGVGSDGKVFVAYGSTDVNVYDNELNFLYKLPKYENTCCQLGIDDIQPGTDGIVYILDRNIGLIKYTPQPLTSVKDGQLLAGLKIYPSPAQGGSFTVDTEEPVAQVTLMNSTGQQEQHSSAQIQTQMTGLLLLKVRMASGKELVGKVVVE